MKAWQQPLPPIYRKLSDAELRVRIQLAKEALGSRLAILGHHYQQDAVIDFADYTGDSFELSRKAADQKGVESVVGWGGHCMAGGAHDSGFRVQGPNATAAGTFSSSLNPDPRALNPSPTAGGTKILFFPDQHLGRNTAYSMGYPLDRMIVWDPKEDLGGNTPEQVRNADFILWKGHCSVHALFRPEHVDQVRQKYPDMKVIVHPECKWEVVQKADMAGSTAYIVKQIEAAPPGSQWAIGTEVHLVHRLARQHPEQKIIVLSDCQCLCTTMYRIDLPHLCWVLENLLEGKVVNEIRVDAHTRQWATIALERMLAIKGTGNPLGKQQPAGTNVD